MSEVAGEEERAERFFREGVEACRSAPMLWVEHAELEKRRESFTKARTIL